MKSFFKKNITNLLTILVCIGLILFWILASVLFINRASFSVVTFNTQNQITYNYPTFKLSQNKVFLGKFKAKDDNLGVIIIRLNAKQILKSSKNLIFKFKKVGGNKWDYVQSYSINLFDSQPSFSFGIPIISNSDNRNFVFELSSKDINSNNYLLIKNPDTFVTAYKYSRSQIFANKLSLIHFMYGKIIGSFSDVNFVVHSSVYLLPLIIFLTFVTLFKKKRINWKVKVHSGIKLKLGAHYLKYIILLYVIAELLFAQPMHILNIPSSYLVIILWLVLLFIFKFKSSKSFQISFVLIVIWIVIIPFGLLDLQENLNILVYFSFVTGVIQLLIEERQR